MRKVIEGGGLPFYRKSVSEIFKLLKSSPQGLSAEEAERRLLEYGPNELPTERPPSPLYLLFSQLKSPLVYVLLFAALVAVFLRDLANAVFILLIVVLNTAVGFFQEFRSERSLEELKRILVPYALIRRRGKEETIAASQIVPGDILVLRSGFKVPADGRLFKSVDLEISEALLTGEAAAVKKTSGAFRAKRVLGERKNMVFAGTEIVSGHGLAVVTATGAGTEMGRIARLIKTTVERATPLQQKLAHFGRLLSLAIVSLTLILFFIGLLVGRPPAEIFLLAVTVAVASIPEGLLVALTIILTVGMQRILKRKALVRKLLAAETLGSTTVVCVDKTGTLTEGKMAVVRWEAIDQGLARLASALCNNLSNPTEMALWQRLKELDHFDPQKMVEGNKRLAEIPFSSRRKFMATLNLVTATTEGGGSDPKGEARPYIFAKGAPEEILAWCKMGIGEREEWEKLVEAWGEEGLRILALASKEVQSQKSKVKSPDEFLSLEVGSGFTFLGLSGFSDPIRSGVKKAFEECREAGIRVVVITGDYRATAEKVLSDLGRAVSAAEIVEGRELENLSDLELGKGIKKVKLFARTTPEQKLRIVEALQAAGEVVAMTGDGVNDAPALKKADIGVVVGSGTEVAKETGDLVLLDDNFRTIVAAVEEGRNIFGNLRKVITYLLSGGFSEIILVAGSLFFGLPFFILPAQVLWINIIADGLPALALAFEEREKHLMRSPPLSRSEPILNVEMKVLIFIIGLSTDLLLLLLALVVFRFSGDLAYTQTIVFVALGTNSLFYVFACRSLRRSFREINPFRNHYLNLAVVVGFTFLVLAVYLPPFNLLLRTEFLGALTWLFLLGLGLVNFLAVEAGKWFFIRKESISAGGQKG